MWQPNPISFRDPAARVLFKNGRYIRLIHNNYARNYEHLMQSGLYRTLVDLGWLIPHKELSSETVSDDTAYVLEPQQIPFQSFPFEWSYLQWQQVVETYLKINEIALQYGMILKDATPYNFHFYAGRAQLIDTSSFDVFKEGEPWRAYKSFCEQLFSPLALMHDCGNQWSQLGLAFPHGLPLEFVSQQLPKRTWFSLTHLLHIHLHARFIQRASTRSESNSISKGFSTQKLQSLFAMILKTVKSWQKTPKGGSHWVKYYDVNIESPDYLEQKKRCVQQWLLETQPKTVLDLGANTGKFAFLAAEFANTVIALESDPRCVDLMFMHIQDHAFSGVIPVVGNVANPSPSLGMLNKAIPSFTKRAKVEMVLALALIHHLYFTEDMSFDFMATLFAEHCQCHVVVEFIPLQDPMAQRLKEGKEHRELGYTQDDFIVSMLNHFELLTTIVLPPNQRVLMLFIKK